MNRSKDTADATVRPPASRWLAQLHRKALAHDLAHVQARTAPDEVVHRRVNGQTVIARRLLHRRTTNPQVDVGVEDEIERARRYT